jgi:hypothetical protein
MVPESGVPEKNLSNIGLLYSYIRNIYEHKCRKETPMTRESDRAKFTKLASARVSKALKDIQLIGNLSNRSNYDYTDEDIVKIFKALSEELSASRHRFETAKKKTLEPKFVLD